VTLVVADGKGDEVKDGINIIDIGRKNRRIARILVSTFLVWRKSLLLKARIFHIHDPELLPAGLFLRLFGCKIVFDMHENLPQQLLTKYYLNRSFSVVLSKLVHFFQNISFRFLPVVFAENSYAKHFWPIKHHVTVLNYPIVTAIPAKQAGINRKFRLGYIGEISHERGINQIITILENIGTDRIELMLAGPVRPDVSENLNYKNAQSAGWLMYHGQLSPKEAWREMGNCDVGLALLFPSPNFFESYPTKLFEYMVLGLPVIASDFPLWKEIIVGNQCGICVNPTDSKAIAAAINYLAENPKEAEELGKRGRKAVEEKYNWKTEEAKLLALYNQLINKPK